MDCSRNESAGRGGLQSYLCAIKNETILSLSEECALAEAVARGDKIALSRMIRANLRLVVKIASDYVGRGLALDDLVGEGNLGLIRAAEKFEPRFGTRFSTYASFWIKQAIRLALSNSTAVIRLPAHVSNLLYKWRKAERALERELGRAPSFNEVALSLGLSESQIFLLAKARLARQVKLESTVARDTGRWSPVDSSDPCGPPALVVECQEDRRLLRSRLERLDGRERTVLSLRYGLDNELPMTLREIGDRLGVTREWVRKIELNAVRKLRGERPIEADEPKRRPTRTNPQRRAGKLLSRHANPSIAGTKTHPRLPYRAADRVSPKPPVVAVTMFPSPWTNQWPSIDGAIPCLEAEALSTS